MFATWLGQQQQSLVHNDHIVNCDNPLSLAPTLPSVLSLCMYQAIRDWTVHTEAHCTLHQGLCTCTLKQGRSRVRVRIRTSFPTTLLQCAVLRLCEKHHSNIKCMKHGHWTGLPLFCLIKGASTLKNCLVTQIIPVPSVPQSRCTSTIHIDFKNITAKRDWLHSHSHAKGCGRTCPHLVSSCVLCGEIV